MAARNILCGVFIIVILIQDIREYKIKNITNLIFTVCGLLAAFLSEGADGLKSAVLGMLIPLVLMILYALRMLGAGDIKAFCTMGAIMGIERIPYIIMYSIIAGGVIGAVFLFLNKSWKKRFSALWEWIACCMYEKKPRAYSAGEKDAFFRFSYALAAGYIINLIITVA